MAAYSFGLWPLVSRCYMMSVHVPMAHSTFAGVIADPAENLFSTTGQNGVDMPVMNGLEAALGVEASYALCTLLLFTNNAGEILRKDALAAGIFAVVSKSDSDSSKQLVAYAGALLGLDVGWRFSGPSIRLTRTRQRRKTGGL